MRLVANTLPFLVWLLDTEQRPLRRRPTSLLSPLDTCVTIGPGPVPSERLPFSEDPAAKGRLLLSLITFAGL